ncbi:hypothetical protein [Bacteroides sp. AF16-49]|jgi:hypothetical protein|uniref:hypothetical protein n=1 Tax=Bacteroides sp. AF16-49 TaxID=2292192 RepID=UPI000F002ACC|nr:hypothetical protein [Bacteroides sp. AF16-49]
MRYAENQYNENFKKYAVFLTYKENNILKVSCELSIPYSRLYKWRKDYSSQMSLILNKINGTTKVKE